MELDYKKMDFVLNGRPFHLVTDALDAAVWRDGPVPARVDLVYGATVWYTVEEASALAPRPLGEIAS